jgi:hypothetical protein
LPFAIVGIVANVLWPSPFRVGLGTTGLVLGLGEVPELVTVDLGLPALRLRQ